MHGTTRYPRAVTGSACSIAMGQFIAPRLDDLATRSPGTQRPVLRPRLVQVGKWPIASPSSALQGQLDQQTLLRDTISRSPTIARYVISAESIASERHSAYRKVDVVLCVQSDNMGHIAITELGDGFLRRGIWRMRGKNDDAARLECDLQWCLRRRKS